MSPEITSFSDIDHLPTSEAPEPPRMKMSHDLPPMLDAIRANGMDPVVEKTCFTYGDVIYNPGKLNVPPDMFAHEETHSFQQGGNPAGWWSRYLTDQWFRIDQEVEAFAVQYVWYGQHVSHDRNARARFLFKLSALLAAPTYGSVIGSIAAQRMIQAAAGKVRL
jgi:hypothetical protein